MLEYLKKLAELYGIDPLIILIIVIAIAILGMVVSFAYKENLFGFKNIIRRILRAKPEDKLCETDTKDDSASAPTVEKKIELTSPVCFENERLPNTMDLQKAVHIIMKSKSSFSIPFLYNEKIALLKQKIENLYEHYEQRIEKAGGTESPEDFSHLRNSINFANEGLNGLPRVVGLAVERLSREKTELSDINITKVCSRFIELRMTSILASITRFQLDNEPAVLLDYARLSSHQQYVAKVDEIALNALVSYRIQFLGDNEERTIFVPRKWLHILSEFNTKGVGYCPPLWFMIDYCYPQMLHWFVNDPNRWNFEWRCQSVFVKDLDGNYIDDILYKDLKE